MTRCRLTREHPDKQVVFFGIGSEHACANAVAVHLADREGLDNFSVLVSHVLVPPAISALMESPQRRVQGFLAAGHVCAVMGMRCRPLVERYRRPDRRDRIEPLDVLEGIRRTLLQLEQGRAKLENAYPGHHLRGQRPTQEMVLDVFSGLTDRAWRGIGMIPASGSRISTDTHSSTPSSGSTSPASTRRSRRSAVAAKSCRD